MELTKLENQLPLKAYPEKELDLVLESVFVIYISKLLTIKPDNKQVVLDALPAVKKKFHLYGMNEVAKAFEMYADGELSIKPKSNYFDRVLVGHVFDAFKNHTKTDKPEETPEEKADAYKANQDFIYAVQAFDYYIQNGDLPIDSHWLYNYLKVKEIINYTDEAIKQAFKQAEKTSGTRENQIEQGKLILVLDHFKKLKENGLHVKNQIDV